MTALDGFPLPATITAARLDGAVLVGQVAVEGVRGRVVAITFRYGPEEWLRRKHLHRATGVEIDEPAEALVGRRVRVVLGEWPDSDGGRRLGVRRWLRPMAEDCIPARHGAGGQAR